MCQQVAIEISDSGTVPSDFWTTLKRHHERAKDAEHYLVFVGLLIALTLTAMTLNAMTLNAMTLNAMTLNSMSLNAMILSAMTLKTMTLNAMTPNALTFYCAHSQCTGS